MRRADLMKLEELKGLQIVLDADDLGVFLAKLRQDCYAPEKIADEKYGERLAAWRKARKTGAETFFAVYDEPDDQQKNDGWGHYELYRCVAIQTDDGQIHVLKKEIARFDH